MNTSVTDQLLFDFSWHLSNSCWRYFMQSIKSMNRFRSLRFTKYIFTERDIEHHVNSCVDQTFMIVFSSLFECYFNCDWHVKRKNNEKQLWRHHPRLKYCWKILKVSLQMQTFLILHRINLWNVILHLWHSLSFPCFPDNYSLEKINSTPIAIFFIALSLLLLTKIVSFAIAFILSKRLRYGGIIQWLGWNN